MKKSWIKSLGYAVQGLSSALKSERNLRIHFCFALFALLIAWFLNISHLEWALIFLAIGMVIITELINTAVEKTIDLSQANYDPLVKVAKDIAAGAVLVAAVTSVMIGLLVLGPYLLRYW